MKILVYGINYSPELTGIGKYTGEMVEWLAAQGHEVRVITAPPYYPQWQVGENYSAWRYKREEGAATVWRCPLYVPKQPSTLKRLLHLGSFAVSSFFPLMAQRRWKPDRIIGVVPTLFCTPGMRLLAKLSGARTVLHIQDYEVDAMLGLGLAGKGKGGKVAQLATAFERSGLHNVDNVSTISRSMMNKAIENAGHEIIVLDNFSNASYKCIEKIKEITRRDFITITGDAGCRKTLSAIFEKHAIDIVIHFAGFKSVSESKSEPLKYYQNNVGVTITLLQVMEEYRIKKFIFSSSATVYGEPEIIPIPETAKIGGTTNPYGTSKYFVEKILEDVSSTGKLDIICLRYFNPVGAHSSGKIGEAPSGIPNNLVPYLLDVASGKRDKLFIYGNDYPTNDGTGVRDFIHVVDLAKGHLAAMNYLSINSGYNIFNLGTGKGYSVLELITTFEKLTNIKVNKSFIERRAGDVASCWADADKANSLLDWQAEQTLEQMLLDSWRWKKNYPDGF
ncbi:TPA: UDP-glucose 4-epimerase GalE [Escherichia coli]